MKRRTVVDEITDRIAFQIASGKLARGDRLPSVRTLADDYGINTSTVQLVLGQLRSAGFVEPRHGLGVVVRDIEADGGIETWRYLFRFSRRLPDLMVRIVRDVLETLQLFYASFAEKAVTEPGAYDPAPVRRALGRLELMIAAGDTTPQDTHEAVLRVLRAGSLAFGGGIALGLLNSVAPMLGEIPEVRDVLYADPGAHAWWWDQLVTAWENADAEGARASVALLDAWHTEILETLAAKLGPAA